MKTGVLGWSAASARSRLWLTTSAGRIALATSQSHSAPSRAARSSRPIPDHGGRGPSCKARMAAPAAAQAAGDAVDGSPRRPIVLPARAANARTGGSRHRISGVGTGASVMASTSRSALA